MGLRVDGTNAYLSAAASQLYYVDPIHKSSAITGIPALSLTKSVDPGNGNVHIQESGGLARCAPNAAAFHVAPSDPAWATDCTSFAPLSVKLERTIDTDKGGRRAVMTDVWSSTDGQSHQLDLQYEEEFAGDLQHSSPFFSYSWTGAGKATPAVAASTVPGPGAEGPATVYADGNEGAAVAVLHPGTSPGCA